MPYRRFKRSDPRRYSVQLATILGRRGSVLFLLGVIWVFQGIATYTFQEPSAYPLLNDYHIPRTLGWIVTGFAAIWFSFSRQGYDAFGFLALYIMGAYRIIAYGWEFLLWALPPEGGNPRGIVGVFSWFVIVSLLYVVAGWKEVEEVKVDESRLL